ncbi:hypothetical protein D8Y22_13760 [Salinadaptatus halalkaliphilus]|uniref:Uncharacterized protein n=1 Tax=Salinadaptatus halalkaliphilus TaxID=2419781 RepID=A0A4S3TJP6_9EURY|nr:hypothetical protein [Salinadaptatus halalkaliphilus]THE64294.1 hypothetical protein D8Y22_13760 [Salinadaptatus halalkaliphilus]
MGDIEGQIITAVRHLAGDDHDGLVWTVDLYDNSLALELGDGSLLISVDDLEGNRPGVFNAKGVDEWDDIAGSLITDMSPMSSAAMEYRGWNSSENYRPLVITLDSGEQLYPSADPGGNQLGVLFRVKNGETFIVDFESVDTL